MRVRLLVIWASHYVKYARIRVKENPYSCIFWVVSVNAVYAYFLKTEKAKKKHTSFYKGHFWNWQKIKQMLSNNFRLNFCSLKIIHILYRRYYAKIIRHTLKNKQKNKCVCFHEILRLITMKVEMKMKSKSHRYDINTKMDGYKFSKYKNYLIMMITICIKQHLSNIWSRFMKKLSSTEAEFVKRVAYKKACIALGKSKIIFI